MQVNNKDKGAEPKVGLFAFVLFLLSIFWLISCLRYFILESGRDPQSFSFVSAFPGKI
jgi:hypothetical protein